MTPSHNQNLKSQYANTFLRLSVIFFIGVLLADKWAESKRKEQVIHATIIYADIVGHANKQALKLDYYETTSESLSSLSEVKDIVYACLYDAKEVSGVTINKLVGRYQNKLLAPPNYECPAKLENQKVVENYTLKVMNPIYYDNDIIGYIYVESYLK